MSSKLKRPLSSSDRSISPPCIRKKPRVSDDVECQTPPGSDQIRIFSWNVNGSSPLTQKRIAFDPNSLFPLRTFLKRHDWPHLLCLQEVKINSQDRAAQRRLESAANHGALPDENTYTLHVSLPRDRYNATGFGGKVYGVATLVRHDFEPHINMTRKPDWDLEGRVLIHETIAGLVVINGYWVNGTTNRYRDPETGLEKGTRHEHKLRFHEHMLNETINLEGQGFRVLLIGDMNVARAPIDGHPDLRTSPVQHVKNRADFNNKFFFNEKGMRGIDVFRHIHGSVLRYTYFNRSRPFGESCDRVDLIIASRRLVEDDEALWGTDICDNQTDLGHSDHVPLWVTLNMSKIRSSNRINTKPNCPEIRQSPSIL